MHRPSFSPPTPRLLTLLSLLALVGVGACKKKEEPKPDASAAKAPVDAKADAAPEPAAPVVAAAGPGRLSRSNGLGHFMIANPSTFIAELRKQAVPSMYSMFVSEEILRNYLSGMLGERGKLAEHLRFDQPLGCAVVDVPPAKEDSVPLTCVFGYTGGADSLLVDLGESGKEDASGHAGHYKFEGEDVYIDAVGDMVVSSNQPDAFEAAKNYINNVMIARAGALEVDLEIVAFASAAFKRYEKPLTDFVKQTQGMAAPPPQGELANNVADYSEKANQQTLEQIKNSEQIQAGLGFDEKGFLINWVAVPVAGSEMETRNQKLAGATIDADHMGALPQASWAVLAANSLDLDAPSSLRDAGVAAVVGAIVEQTGRKREEVDTQVNSLIQEFQDLYGAESVSSIMHLPDTVGGMVVEVPLKEGKSGREAWKAWSAGFTPASVLGAEGAKKVAWSFKPDAETYEEVPVDRWLIQPTAEGLKDLKKEAKDWEKRTDGFKLVVDRVEVDGRAAFVVTAGEGSAYTHAVIDGLHGKATIKDAPGYGTVKERAGDYGSLIAIDVQRASDWLRRVVPAEEAGKIPPSVGVDLNDVVVVNGWTEGGFGAGEARLSQAFIDRIRAQFEQQE